MARDSSGSGSSPKTGLRAVCRTMCCYCWSTRLSSHWAGISTPSICCSPLGYPILDLAAYRKDLHWYLRTLEQALIEALGILAIPAERNPGFTGVWTGGRKIASIGIHVKQWVTWHGFALNVTTDLAHFERIVPCGIPGVVMTSVQRERGAGSGEQLWGEAVQAVIRGFEMTFDVDPILKSA